MSTKVVGPAVLTRTQAAQTVYGLLQYTEKKDIFDVADVMGFSGHAFRITIHRETVSPAGPTVYSPYDLIGRPLELFGCSVEKFGMGGPFTPEQLEQFVSFVQRSIDKGWPVAGWDLFAPEFGIIYGYDHEKQVLYARDVDKDGTIAYSELGNLRFGTLHAIAIKESTPVELLPLLRKSLKRSVAFCKGEMQKEEKDLFRNGLAGYDAWAEAFHGRRINVVGNAYNTAVVSDAREFAVSFFRSFKQKWTAEVPLEQSLVSFAEEAADLFEAVAEPLVELLEMFPFPQGGEPNDPAQAEKAIQLLQRAKSAEEQAVAVMEKMLMRLEEEER